MDSDWSFVHNSNNLKTTSMSKLSQLPVTGWINYDVIIQWDTVILFSQSCVPCYPYLHGNLSSFSFRWGYCHLEQNQNSFYQKEVRIDIHKELVASTMQLICPVICDCLSNEWYSHRMEYSVWWSVAMRKNEVGSSMVNVLDIFLIAFYFLKIFIHLFIWLPQVLVRLELASIQDLCCGACKILGGSQALEFMSSAGLGWSAACGILVPWPGFEPMSPALEGRFLCTGPPGMSLS